MSAPPLAPGPLVATSAVAPGFLAFGSRRLAASGIALRPAVPGDAALIAALYATTREQELRAVGWTPGQMKAFTDSQSALQEKHYLLHYPDAERLVVEKDGAIGRIYVETRAEVRLMEVTLLPAWRGQGIGTRLLQAVLDYADELGLAASLHVEPSNPARRMYERAGFAVSETRGPYEFMVRPIGRPA